MNGQTELQKVEVGLMRRLDDLARRIQLEALAS